MTLGSAERVQCALRTSASTTHAPAGHSTAQHAAQHSLGVDRNAAQRSSQLLCGQHTVWLTLIRSQHYCMANTTAWPTLLRGAAHLTNTMHACTCASNTTQQLPQVRSISAPPMACPLRGYGVPVLKMTTASPRRGGDFVHRHFHTRAMDMPSAVPRCL